VLHADVVVLMWIYGSHVHTRESVILYANNIKMMMMKDEMRRTRERARKINNFLETPYTRMCISKCSRSSLSLVKQRRKVWGKCSTIFIYYICINPSPRLSLTHSSLDKNRIMRRECNAMFTQLYTRREGERALIVLNWIACKKQIKIELKLIEVDARLS
jgi:hypothetical protein